MRGFPSISNGFFLGGGRGSGNILVSLGFSGKLLEHDQVEENLPPVCDRHGGNSPQFGHVPIISRKIQEKPGIGPENQKTNI